jgi:hypothetical protein
MLLAVSFAALVMSLSIAIAGDFIPGDVNDDGIFDVLDSTVLRRALAGLGPGMTQECVTMCGNGLLDANEDCDFGELAGQTCVDVGFDFGTLSCEAGCTFDTSGCTNTRFVDNSDGTVTDNDTGLMWEKKDPNSGCLHCVDDWYNWTTVYGSMFDWLSEVNGLTDDPNTQTGFAGYTDWRIPNIVELQTILLEAYPCGTDPCIDPIFGPVASAESVYWSSSTYALDPVGAWAVEFSYGEVDAGDKNWAAHVRAVRGGL